MSTYSCIKTNETIKIWDHPHGALICELGPSGLIVNAIRIVNITHNHLIDGISNDVTLAEDSPTHLVTEHAVKTYVDNKIGVAVPLTTKGDLLTHNGTLPARLGVGANGTFLTANNAMPTGITWGNTTANDMTFTSATYHASDPTHGAVVVTGSVGARNFNASDYFQSPRFTSIFPSSSSSRITSVADIAGAGNVQMVILLVAPAGGKRTYTANMQVNMTDTVANDTAMMNINIKATATDALVTATQLLTEVYNPIGVVTAGNWVFVNDGFGNAAYKFTGTANACKMVMVLDMTVIDYV